MNFLCFIFWGNFWFAPLPLRSIFKFQYLAQFPVDQLLPWVVPTFEIFLPANLRHFKCYSIFICLTVSFLSPHIFFFLFWSSVIFKIFLVLTILFDVGIRKDSVSSLRFPHSMFCQCLFMCKFVTYCILLALVVFFWPFIAISLTGCCSLLCILMYPLILCVNILKQSSILVNSLSRSFLDTYNLCYLSYIRPCTLL